jgi:hypothetical protein
MNGANNGTNLGQKLHSGWKNWNEWHKWYNDLAKRMLDKAYQQGQAAGITDEEAAQVAQKIGDDLARIAKQACGQ